MQSQSFHPARRGWGGRTFAPSFLAPLPTLLILVLPALAQTGSLQGLVQDSSGNPVSGTTVRISRFPDFTNPANSAKIGSIQPVTLQTGADGRFVAAALPAGYYGVCAAPKTRLELDPCAWRERPSTVNVVAGRVADVPIRMLRGREVQIRLNDPNGWLDGRDAKYPREKFHGEHLAIALGPSAQGLMLLSPVSVTSGSRVYSVIAPVGPTLSISVRSRLFAVSSPGRAAFDSRSDTRHPVRLAASQQPEVVEFSVTGPHPPAPVSRR